jgi:hypothetical protein
MADESPPKSSPMRAQIEALRAKADREMDEAEAQEIARQIPNWPLQAEWRSKIAKLLDGQPDTVRLRVRQLVRERWDRECVAPAPLSAPANDAARIEQARILGLAAKDVERLKRSSEAAVAFASRVFGKSG